MMVRDSMLVLGVVSVVCGCGMLSVPLACIVFGVMCLCGFAVRLTRGG